MDASCERLQKLLSRSALSRRLSGTATTVIRIIIATRHYTMQVGNPYRPHFWTTVQGSAFRKLGMRHRATPTIQAATAGHRSDAPEAKQPSAVGRSY